MRRSRASSWTPTRSPTRCSRTARRSRRSWIRRTPRKWPRDPPTTCSRSGRWSIVSCMTPVTRRPFPSSRSIWVGYEKRQSVDTLCASFADLHEPQTVDGILVASPYTEVIAAMVYGVGTIAMPEAPMRHVLAQDVAHRLAAAHPTGEIRLTILAQDGGDEPGSHVCMPEPAKKPLSVDTGMRKSRNGRGNRTFSRSDRAALPARVRRATPPCARCDGRAQAARLAGPVTELRAPAPRTGPVPSTPLRAPRRGRSAP